MTAPTDSPQTPRTPDEAYRRLLEGNERFVTESPLHPNQDASRRAALAGGQQPFASLLGCSDSRVAAEMIFDVGLGEMFIVRTAGQVTGNVSMGSLEYGVAVLGTPLLVVLGHDGCGAVRATVEAVESGDTPPGFIGDITSSLYPSVVRTRRGGDQSVDGAVAQNVVDTVHSLAQRSHLLRRALLDGSLQIVGLTYDLHDGRVREVARLTAEDPGPTA
ncbi:carbonic anhydrase [Brevibacterium litoralis]|uniref:carbonic anhydrase n=1 Tax=Brevibacterium litoralis TaxID=3138935 RepID=UPI0032EEC8CD